MSCDRAFSARATETIGPDGSAWVQDSGYFRDSWKSLRRISFAAIWSCRDCVDLLIGILKDVFSGCCLCSAGPPFCVGYRHKSPSLFLKCKQVENFFSVCLSGQQRCDYFCMNNCIVYKQEHLSTQKFLIPIQLPGNEAKIFPVHESTGWTRLH